MLTKLSDYTRENCIADKIGVEGGYTNDPADAGGETKFGISFRVAMMYKDQLVSQFNWDGKMINLSQAMAVYIYVQEYWNKMSLDSIMAMGGRNVLLADLLFEAGINMGVGTIVQALQNILNVLNLQENYYDDVGVDGGLGQKTVDAIKALIAKRPMDGMPNLLFLLSAEAAHHYIALTLQKQTQERFMSGWANRARLQYDTYVDLHQW